ncbi:hypothetical protein [Kribbella sp. NPDC006257]|uniref:hypothetical protein n=1 Tax=Kribbella sp. NPDC006257 TaxID=3156738 RepID=UPI0033A6A317
MITLDGLVVPDTTASSAALEVASAYHSPALMSHSHRVYLWAAALGTQYGIPYDAEQVFVAANAWAR